MDHKWHLDSHQYNSVKFYVHTFYMYTILCIITIQKFYCLVTKLKYMPTSFNEHNDFDLPIKS